jgi:hypothetical protein
MWTVDLGISLGLEDLDKGEEKQMIEAVESKYEILSQNDCNIRDFLL